MGTGTDAEPRRHRQGQTPVTTRGARCGEIGAVLARLARLPKRRAPPFARDGRVSQNRWQIVNTVFAHPGGSLAPSKTGAG